MYKSESRPYAAFIGRFQPFHIGHFDIIKESLEEYESIVVVLGSAQSAPSIKNPFTPEHRESMIRSCFSEEENKRLKFTSVRDYYYNVDFWLTEVRNKVLRTLKAKDLEVNIVGHFKDSSSYYLKLFPTWGLSEVRQKHGGISATTIREDYLSKNIDFDKDGYLPAPVKQEMIKFSNTEAFANLAEEFAYIKKYKEDTRFVGVNYAPTFITTDAVVVQSGHVLVVRRKHNPGKGTLALPGGFIKEDETLKDACIRELKEETRISLPKAILKANIKDQHVFDEPNRSLRGRTITNAFYIPLPENLEHGLPFVEGSDDAKEAFWLPIADVFRLEDEFFEDHAHIIRHFTKIM